MTDRDARLERMLAKDEIVEVIMRVARATDRLDKELIISGYHPDAVDDHGGFTGGPVAFADWVEEILSPFACTQHFLGNVSLDLDLENEFAHTETYVEGHHLLLPDESGRETDWVMNLRYVDRFERRGGPWLIARRICLFDFEYAVPIAERWQLGDTYRRGARNRSDPSYER